MVHELSRTDARRLALRGQLLTGERPDDWLAVLRRLTILQHDQTNHVARNADLVLWTRLGSSYSPDDLATAVEEQRVLELEGRLRPCEDLALFRADMADWPGRGRLRPWQEEQRQWVEANTACRLDILDRLRMAGPLPASELPDTCARPWRSSGWNNHRNVVMLLHLLVARGEVASAGREGRETLWDLAERVYPDDPVVPAPEAARVRDERRLRSLGIARARAAAVPGEPSTSGDAGEPAVIEGVKGRWRVDPQLLEELFAQPFTARAALLSPLDRLVFDRRRTHELFDFDYQLEMYKPRDQRRWGYWALPVLYGDRLVGKLDATADRREGELRVDALHEDVPFTKAMTAAVDEEIRDLAGWLGLELVVADETS
ncbi:winged helix DNA-binding domain-containing protein [Nocardioides sp. cx-169]|uniref:DNA glycosylase AlkZ-like family protein n=1 Tax=Nocardioides sp. cx-169 TaxID=2899080 RepID=UPI001E5DCCA2|nr:crosslink repair DNA glycosylase YcaQ family protein [Nocardioides sp. cx-169]MCD4535598.1 winged helix DNA-binding domain-containing protein [Nocardioides sp. cx-169]